MSDFKKIVAWQKAHQLVLSVYKTTQSFPGSELYGLTSQIRRAAVSIPANIAEGYGRKGDPDRRRFLILALGSAKETEYHLLLAHDLGYIIKAEYEDMNTQVDEVQKILEALIKKLGGP